MVVSNYTNRIVSGKGICPVCGQRKSWSYAQGDRQSRPTFVICYGSSPATPGWKYLGDNDFGGGKYIRTEGSFIVGAQGLSRNATLFAEQKAT